jgi:hypothetical protein
MKDTKCTVCEQPADSVDDRLWYTVVGKDGTKYQRRVIHKGGILCPCCGEHFKSF